MEWAAAKDQTLIKNQNCIGTRITTKNTKNTTKSEYQSHPPQIHVYQERKGTRLNYHLKAIRASTAIINHDRIWWYQTDMMEPPKAPRLLKASNIYFCSFYIAVFIENKEGYRNEAQKLFCIVWNVKKFRENQFLHFCLFRDKKGIWFCVFGQVQ